MCFVFADVEAGWKFWKKKDKDASTTVAPNEGAPAGAVTPEGAIITPSLSVPSTTAKPGQTRPNTGSAIIGAGNPGLAVGVGASGQDIRNNARPQRPNPGTEVGLDIGMPKPPRPGTGGQTSGQGYRDWAADLTGAGEPGRRPPNLPGVGPALSGPDSRPTSLPGSPSQPQPSGGRPASMPMGGAVQPQSPGSGSVQPQPAGPTTAPRITPVQPQSPGGRPSTGPGSPTGSISSPDFPALGPSRAGQNQPTNGGGQVSTLHVGTLKPGSSTTPAPVRPGSPSDPSRSWADVAGGGSRPNSPTPSPRLPVNPNQPATGPVQPHPQSPNQPGPSPSRPSPGAIAAGGALAGAAGAAGVAAAAGAAGSTTTTSNGNTYSSNPTYSKGNTITDDDLEKLAEALFIKESNNANRHITLNIQKRTSSSSPTDEAPQPLFTVNPAAYEILTIQRLRSIFDNYQLDTHANEYISPAQRQEESLLVDTFLSTNVMSAAMRFLADKGHIRKDYYEYKDVLRKLWFNLFSRGQGKIGSTGFEHVFMAELKPGTPNPEVLGLHNWVYFSIEESKRKVDYLGYLKKVDLGNKGSIIKIHAKFNGHDKPVTTMFVGTSPELEMALYTVCFYARPDGPCPVSLGGTKFNIVTHKFKYRGNDLVGTAYPDI